MLIFTLTIFLGALLLFQVELIIGKTILPWFGGTSAVWITCMLFFQVLLLGGYAYGHALDRRARAAAQTVLHRVLLLVSLLALAAQFFLWHSPLILDASWKPRAGGNPLLQIIALLTVSVGLPYLVLASTAPLLQSWWRRLYPQRSPYRLYAVSNFGSFLGLVSYPFLVEPFLTLRTQARVWSWCFAVFAIGCAYCAFRAARAGAPAAAENAKVPLSSTRRSPELASAALDQASSPPTRPGVGVIALWLSLAACASALLLATTNQLCKNVAAVPLLWVLPLAVYLLTFTLCFESDRRYSRKWYHPAFALGMFLVCFVLATGAGKNLPAQIAIYSFGLFAACMVCHGELARLKPDPSHLTLFYLVVAAGGVLGGLFVALAAPYLFLGYWEYEISLWLAVLLLFVVLYRDRSSWFYSTRVKSPIVLLGAAALLPESMALAIGKTQLAGSIPSVIVIVAALFFLQGQTMRRKSKPSAGAAGQANSTPKFTVSGSSKAHTSAASAADASLRLGLDDIATPSGLSATAIAVAPPMANSAAPAAATASARVMAATAAIAAAPAPAGNFSLLASCAIVLLILGAAFTTLAKASMGGIASVRNFYGALYIDRQHPLDPDLDSYALKHGEIVHGFEFRIPQKHLIPTSYFSEESGLGLLLAPHLHAGDPPGAPHASGGFGDASGGVGIRPSGDGANASGANADPAAAPLRIGDVGLGIGTVAAYTRPGDSLRFYEINPQVVELASNPRYFQFLHESAAPVDVALGDGRLSLERELAQGAQHDYDVLIVDAFNGDAVPVHLLTIEAFEVYLQRLKPGGVLAMNVTNTFLDLRPVVAAAAARLGLVNLWVHCDGDDVTSYTNDWMLLSQDPAKLGKIAAAANDTSLHPLTHAAPVAASDSRLWTDDYSNLFQALRDKSRASLSASK